MDSGSISSVAAAKKLSPTTGMAQITAHPCGVAKPHIHGLRQLRFGDVGMDDHAKVAAGQLRNDGVNLACGKFPWLPPNTPPARPAFGPDLMEITEITGQTLR